MSAAAATSSIRSPRRGTLTGKATASVASGALRYFLGSGGLFPAGRIGTRFVGAGGLLGVVFGDWDPFLSGWRCDRGDYLL